MLLVGGLDSLQGVLYRRGVRALYGGLHRGRLGPCTYLGGELYSEIQCILGNIYMGSSLLWTEWRADTTENITFPQPGWRAIIMLFMENKSQRFLLAKVWFIRNSLVLNIDDQRELISFAFVLIEDTLSICDTWGDLMTVSREQTPWEDSGLSGGFQMN